MSGKPYRIPASQAKGAFGRLIDRDVALSFTFDNQSYSGFKGDTLASALLANGVRLFGRSFKYHRPRGVIAAGPEEPNALVSVGSGSTHEPNNRITDVELYEGLVATSQNRWPSLAFDVSAINNTFSRLIPSGFYYKTFMWPAKLWPHYEHIIRHAAGLGTAPQEEDEAVYEQVHVDCDVLIAGGGIAGLAAALAAAEVGARVIIADLSPQFGGASDCIDGKIDAAAPIAWVKKAVVKLAAMENVHILPRTTVTGHYDHNWVLMCERLSDHISEADRLANRPRHRLWKVRAKKVIVATGAFERPLTFANNDRPGVMLASAARAYVTRYGVTPGERAVIFTNNDDAYLTALCLQEAGVSVPKIIDAREDAKSALISRAEDAGIEIVRSSVITNVETSFGGTSIEGVQIATRTATGRLAQPFTRIECDLVCMSGGWNPAVHLFAHVNGSVKFDDDLQTFRPDKTSEAIVAIGAANGHFDLSTTIDESFDAGFAAAKSATGKSRPRKAAPPKTRQDECSPLEALWFAPAKGSLNEGNKHFIDFQNDVTAADIELAAREGYRSVEHLKRYTTLGMATDQGKTSNISALGILADTLNTTIPAAGTTRFRPPFTPFSLGSIAGTQAKHLFVPVRRTPIATWHHDNNCDMEPVGLWRRPFCYRHGNEDRQVAITREILTTREKAGIIDLSSLGKIEVKGPDAGVFLDRIYSNVFSTLKPGRCRYGLMMNEDGFLFDDGVTVRLAQDHFLMHTTSGNADRIVGWLEEWHQTEWPDLKLFITPVTENYAQFAIAGPHSREILQKLESTIDFSREAFTPLDYKTGELCDVPVRIYRISFSGELSFEIAVPANHGLAMWQALMAAGKEFGLTAYGTEPLHVMRAEKGFIAIGDETDGTVTPLDLDLGWAVSKKKDDYIGKRSLQRSFLKGDERKEMVGLLTDDPKEVLPDGCYAVEQVLDRPPMKMIGHVSSSYYSPTLNRSIAFGLIKNGRARMGDTLQFPLEDKVVSAKVVSPVFYDSEGERQNA